jgi:hypothetical protein
VARADLASRSLPDGTASLPLLQFAATCQRGDFLAGFSLGDAVLLLILSVLFSKDSQGGFQ